MRDQEVEQHTLDAVTSHCMRANTMKLRMPSRLVLLLFGHLGAGKEEEYTAQDVRSRHSHSKHVPKRIIFLQTSDEHWHDVANRCEHSEEPLRGALRVLGHSLRPNSQSQPSLPHGLNVDVSALV